VSRLARAALILVAALSCGREPSRPNVILCVSDDQGFGDAGYQGHARLRTPHLDALARRGVRFDRFYATSMCTPTRAGLLTGRHPARFGIITTGLLSLPLEEVTLAETLRDRGWTTGHFGKWHLGTLSRTEAGRRALPARRVENYAPPWDQGFEVCFSTESSVPTWDPLVDPETGDPSGARYWEGPGRSVAEGLAGDDSRLLVDRVEAFVREAAGRGRPFLAVVWFHAPHRPVVAGPDWARAYGDASADEADYWGALSAMDAQVGRLGRLLDELGIRDETLFFFCSDNGPALHEPRWVSPGSPGPFHGGKGGLSEGGLRVPAILDGPGFEPGVVSEPVCFLDFVPTVLAAAGIARGADLPPLDGIDLRGAVAGVTPDRPWPIAFRTRQEAGIVVGPHKLTWADGGKTVSLFDVVADPYESRDLAQERPERRRALERSLEEWRLSCLQDERREGVAAQR